MDEKKVYRPTVDGPVDNIECFEYPAGMSDLCKGLSELSITELYKSSKSIKLEISCG